jgi:TolB-like protein
MEPTLSEDPSRGTHPQAQEPIPAAAVWEELEKLLSSERFREAGGLKRFLRFAVEQTLRGEGDRLKEYRIGVEVLDRGASFDPRIDPAVRMAARRLRAKLMEYYQTEGLEDRVRIDVPKGSYAATFSRGSAADVAAGTESLGEDRKHLAFPLQRSGAWIAVISVLCLIVLVISAIQFRTGRSPVASRQIRSVAVLPLQNLSGDPSQEYLADGLTEELVTDLAQIHSLRVISRTSVMTYKGTKKRLPEIAQELNVDAVVEGSVTRSANRVQVTAQLIEAPTDTHLWAQTYEGNFRDLISLQNQVAQSIVEQVGVKLTAEEQTRLKTVHLANPEAHEAYLLGRYYWNKRTSEGFTKAVEQFQRASKADPKYAMPYAGLADCYVLLAEYTLQPSQDVLPKARDAALRALELDDQLAEAHASLAAVKVDYEWDWRGAEQELRRAIELNPGYVTAHQWYAELLAEEGRSSEAIAEIKHAQELDPFSLIVNAMAGRVLLFAGLTDPAIQQLQKTLELDPSFTIANFDLGRAYLEKGDLRRATRKFQEATKFRVPERMAALAYVYARAGRRAEAHDLWTGYLKHPGLTYVTWYGVAIFYAGWGDRDRAFACLDKALAEHDSRLRDVKQEPLFVGLRSDPRFARLVQSVGL